MSRFMGGLMSTRAGWRRRSGLGFLGGMRRGFMEWGRGGAVSGRFRPGRPQQHGSPRHDGCVPSRIRRPAPEKKVRLPVEKKARVARKQVLVEPPEGRPT